MAKEETKQHKTLVKVVSVIKDGKTAKTVAVQKIRDKKHAGFIDPNENPTIGISKTVTKRTSKKKGK